MSMKLSNRYLLLALSVAVAFVSCKNKSNMPALPADSGSAAVDGDDNAAPDSTIYGEAGDFGMSTFCIVTDHGDTLLMDRTAANGQDGRIYGDAQPGDRYSLITTDNNQALKCAINLTELDRFIKDYKIVNGRLMLMHDDKPQKVEIVWLDEDSLVLKRLDGTNGILKILPKE